MIYGMTEQFWISLVEKHSSELVILSLFAMTMITLIILVPQLLRAHLRKQEGLHQEHLRALEQGMTLPAIDDPTKAAGRTAMLVPMVAVICAGTVTCFMVAYKEQDIFSVVLTVWAVAGVVSLAAITGGVALIGRLAQLRAGEEVDDVPQNPLQG
jgi:hypothetical protein